MHSSNLSINSVQNRMCLKISITSNRENAESKQMSIFNHSVMKRIICLLNLNHMIIGQTKRGITYKIRYLCTINRFGIFFQNKLSTLFSLFSAHIKKDFFIFLTHFGEVTTSKILKNSGLELTGAWLFKTVNY